MAIWWLLESQRKPFCKVSLFVQVFWNFVVRFLLWNNWWRWWWRIWSIVGRKPSSATEPSVQMDLESKIICRRTSDSQTCHTTVSDSHRRGFYFGSRTRAQCEPSSPLICILEISYWLTRCSLLSLSVPVWTQISLRTRDDWKCGTVKKAGTENAGVELYGTPMFGNVFLSKISKKISTLLFFNLNVYYIYGKKPSSS